MQGVLFMIANTLEVVPRLQIASSAPDVFDAWRLLYRAYIDAGYIRPNPYELHTVSEAIGQHCLVMLAHQNDMPVSTISAMADSPRGLPLDSVYPAELEAIRQEIAAEGSGPIV